MDLSTKDISIFESGDGGELNIINGDLVLSNTLYQHIYISLFGGNVNYPTKGNEVKSQERLDYWANDLIFKDRFNKQYNSLTEQTINKVVINSSGRLKIENAVKQDLSYISNIVELSIDVVILDINRLSINLTLSETSNKSNKLLQFIWNSSKNEIIINNNI